MTLPAAPLQSRPDLASADYPRLAYSRGDGGGPRRRGIVDNGVLGMAIFLSTETMLFAGLITAFLVLRAASPSWPPADQPRLPLEVTGVNTLILLSSALTMRRATAASVSRDHPAVARWATLTLALGTTFLLIQGWEWLALLGYGLSASTSLFGATFYTLIGCHALHVLAAVATLLFLRLSLARGADASGPARFKTIQLYWFFVVGVWPVLYVLVYLM